MQVSKRFSLAVSKGGNYIQKRKRKEEDAGAKRHRPADARHLGEVDWSRRSRSESARKRTRALAFSIRGRTRIAEVDWRMRIEARVQARASKFVSHKDFAAVCVVTLISAAYISVKSLPSSLLVLLLFFRSVGVLFRQSTYTFRGIASVHSKKYIFT